MANWYGTCRSNYFAVKDADEFEAEMSKFECTLIASTDKKTGTPLYGFVSDEEYGSIPFLMYDEDGNDLEEHVSILDVIAPHLAENHICVVIEAGAEKARYITGSAFAIHSSGEIVRIFLSDIYKQAQEEFGGDAIITEATY